MVLMLMAVLGPTHAAIAQTSRPQDQTPPTNAVLIDRSGETVRLSNVSTDIGQEIFFDVLHVTADRESKIYGRLVLPLSAVASIRERGAHEDPWKRVFTVELVDGSTLVAYGHNFLAGRCTLGEYRVDLRDVREVTFDHHEARMEPKEPTGVAARLKLRCGVELGLTSIKLRYHWTKPTSPRPTTGPTYSYCAGWKETESVPVMRRSVVQHIPFSYVTKVCFEPRLGTSQKLAMDYQISQEPLRVAGELQSFEHSIDSEAIIGVDSRGQWSIPVTDIVMIDDFSGRTPTTLSGRRGHEGACVCVCETWEGLKWRCNAMEGSGVAIRIGTGAVTVSWSKIEKLRFLSEAAAERKLELTFVGGEKTLTTGRIVDDAIFFGFDDQGLEGGIGAAACMSFDRATQQP